MTAHDVMIAKLQTTLCSNTGACSLCRDGECRVAEKSEEQLTYVTSSIEKNIFLSACPGSGKTEVVGLKAAYEFNHWDRTPGGIAVLTFTNNAASEITERVCQFAGNDRIGFPHFVGTIDSWLHQYIVHPFAHIETKYSGIEGDHSIRLIDETETPLGSTDKSFLHSFEVPFLPIKIYANNIQWTGEEWKVSTIKRGEKQSIAELMTTPNFVNYLSKKDKNGNLCSSWCTEEKISNDFLDTKIKFFKAGMATYSDMEVLAELLLEQHNNLKQKTSQRFPVIIIDECQDLSKIQLSILKLLKDAGTVIHFIGDLNQAIYEFKDVAPIEIKNFTVGERFNNLHLTKNFRSSNSIVGFCNQLVPIKHYPSAFREDIGNSTCICVSYPKKKISELPQWFEELLDNKISTEDVPIDFDNCKIIARGWSTVSKLRATGRQSGFTKHQWPVAAMMLWEMGYPESMPEAINLMGRFVSKVCLPDLSSTTRNNFCPEIITVPSTWRIMVSELLTKCIGHPRLGNLNATWKDWAAHVRSEFTVALSEVLSHCPELSEENIATSMSFKAPNGGGAKVITSEISISNTNKSKIPITTIHDVKGQTFDATMVVSSPNRIGSDGHWTHWLDDPTSEAARLAYVASSRSKHLLVWAVPELNDAGKKQLADLGFVIEELPDNST